MKKIQYTITSKLWFDYEDDIYINEFLDKLRETGEATVVDVQVVETDRDGNVIQEKK